MENIIELKEGTYKVAEGYEISNSRIDQITVSKKPDNYKEYDIVWLGEGRMGMIRQYNGNGKCNCCIDFNFRIDAWDRFDVIYFYTDRTYICCDYIKPATEEDKALFMDVIHAFGYEYKPDKFHKIQRYYPENYEYGLTLKDGVFCAVKINDINYNVVLDGKYKTYKFETLRAAQICADELNKKIKR